MKTTFTHSFRFAALLIPIMVFALSCEKYIDDPTAVLENIEIGEVTEVASTSIGISGGTIKVSKPGTQVDGLEITIPANSFTSAQTVKVSFADIISHELGANFSPISPLITIACDGGYANELMSITIPVTIPTGHIAIGFFLDDSTGKLEGIPFEKISENSITLLTRHFLSGTRLRSGNSSLKSTSFDLNKGANIIISSISEVVLRATPIISTNFKPGTDDWEFVNYGSYLAPGGHCAGQSMTAMWYYYEQKLKGKADLYHQFDQLNMASDPSFMWQDNALGYRFASTIQKDFEFGKWVDRLKLEGMAPSLVFNTFAAAILITGEPQLVLIRNSAGKGGHAMIVYRANFSEGKMYVADPNYPNNRQAGSAIESVRTIDYTGGIFKPYETGLSAGTESIPMDQIGYFGKTAYIEWNQNAIRYAEMVDGTIGSITPNTFPEYTIWAQGGDENGEDTWLTDFFISKSDTLRCFIDCPTSEIHREINGKSLIAFNMYDIEGKQIDHWDRNTFSAYTILKPGLNKIGIYLYAARNGVVDTDGYNRNFFIDFQWLNIYRADIMTTPVTEITKTTVKTGGNVKSLGTEPVTGRGVCWSTSPYPKISGSKTADGTGTGIFTSSLTNLVPDTWYYVRAYATDKNGTYYGDQIEFKTSSDFDFSPETFEISVRWEAKGTQTNPSGAVSDSWTPFEIACKNEGYTDSKLEWDGRYFSIHYTQPLNADFGLRTIHINGYISVEKPLTATLDYVHQDSIVSGTPKVTSVSTRSASFINIPLLDEVGNGVKLFFVEGSSGTPASYVPSFKITSKDSRGWSSVYNTFVPDSWRINIRFGT